MRNLAILTLLLSLAADANALGFDFAADSFELAGNHTFFDDFGDGSFVDPPTSAFFVHQGAVHESGGLLHFTDTDGFGSNPDFADGLGVDSVVLDLPISDAASGSTSITATFRPDLPVADGFTHIALDMFDDAIVEGVVMAILDLTAGPFVLFEFFDPAVLPPDASAGIFQGVDTIDPSAVTGPIVLQMTIDHPTRGVTPRYSLDGGATFVEASEWDLFLGPATAFQLSPSWTAGIHARGFVVPEPGVTLLLLFALASLGRATAMRMKALCRACLPLAAGLVVNPGAGISGQASNDVSLEPNPAPISCCSGPRGSCSRCSVDGQLEFLGTRVGVPEGGVVLDGTVRESDRSILFRIALHPTAVLFVFEDFRPLSGVGVVPGGGLAGDIFITTSGAFGTSAAVIMNPTSPSVPFFVSATSVEPGDGITLLPPFCGCGTQASIVPDAFLDADLDGRSDGVDNCSADPNGPLAGPGDQDDADADLIGNVCDGDFDQDLFVGGPDFDVFLQCFDQPTGNAVGPPDDSACQESDMNGDGFVGGPDFDLFLQGFNQPPGPSGPASCGLGWELTLALAGLACARQRRRRRVRRDYAP